MNAIAEGYGFVGRTTPCSRSTHVGTASRAGSSAIDGPREVADTRAVHGWLAARPDVADAKIGAWGISYGGGAIFNSLVAGVPWARRRHGRDLDRSLLRAHAAGAREVRRSSPAS